MSSPCSAPTGAARRRLLNLLLGALKPREGTLTVNGQIAFVPQLFQVSFDYRRSTWC